MIDKTEVSLDGKVAVVTGAAKGIGEATAIALANFGADAICDRVPEGLAATAREVEKTGQRCLTGELDVRDVEAVNVWAAEIDRELGQVDILVNNAGGTFYVHFFDTNAKGERMLADENFTSVTNFVRARSCSCPWAARSST